MGDYLGDYPREELEKFCHALVHALGYFLPQNQGIMIEYQGEKLVVYSHGGQIQICSGQSVENFTPGQMIQMLEDHEEPPGLSSNDNTDTSERSEGEDPSSN